MAERKTFIGAVVDEIAYAFDDIRQKLVEEGWFGRTVTPAHVQEMDGPLPDVDTLNLMSEGRWPPQEVKREDLYGRDPEPPRRSFEEEWAVREPQERSAEADPERGIDR